MHMDTENSTFFPIVFVFIIHVIIVIENPLFIIFDMIYQNLCI